MLSMRGALRVAVALGLLSFLFIRIDLTETRDILFRTHLAWIPLLLLLQLLMLGIQSVRWRILLRDQSIRVSLSDAFVRFWVSRFFSNFFPGHLGGDASRVLYAWAPHISKLDVAGSVIVDRFAGLIALFLVAGVAGLLELSTLRDLDMVWLPPLALALATVLTLIVAGRVPSAILRRWAATARVVDSLARSFQNRSSFLQAVGISVFFYVFAAINVWFAFMALDLAVPFGRLIALNPFVSLAASLPISFNSWGVREGAAVVVYTMLGVTSGEAFAVALLSRSLLLFVAAIGGLLYATRPAPAKEIGTL